MELHRIPIVMSDNFISDANLLIAECPEFSIVKTENQIIVTGTCSILDEKLLVLDNYEVEIHPSELYPHKFPITFEVGGKIPRNIDWHINESNGSCCIKVPPEETLLCKRGLPLLDFVNFQLKPYLFNQTFRRENGYFFNERSHGVKGLLEYFESVLLTGDLSKIEFLLRWVLMGKEPSRTSECVCGSGKKYRKCHRAVFKLLSQIGEAELLVYSKAISTYIHNMKRTI